MPFTWRRATPPASSRTFVGRTLLTAGAAATHRFAVSDDEARFRQVGARFIGERLGRAEVVPLH